MLVFALVLSVWGCRGCARGATPLLAAAGGVMWCWAASVRGPGLAACAGIFLLAGHLGFLLCAPVTPCAACLVILGIESVAAGLLLRGAAPLRWVAAASCAALAVAGVVGGSLASRLAWPMAADRVIGPAAQGGVVVYVLVPGECPGCPEGVGVAMAVEERKIGSAVIVDGRSEHGRRLRRENGIEALPAFVAKRGERVLAVQSGGDVEKFIDRVAR